MGFMQTYADCKHVKMEIEETSNLIKIASVAKAKSVQQEEQKKQKSVAVVAKSEKEIEEENKWKEENKERFMSKMWADNGDYKLSLFFGVVCSILSGAQMPAIGLLFGSIVMDMLEPDPDTLRRKVNLDFMGFVVVGASILIVMFCEQLLFGYVSSKVTHKLRHDLYDHILTMDVGWYDLPQNQPFALNSTLSDGTMLVNGFVRNTFGISIQCMTAIFCGIGIGFGFSWRISLIVLGVVPIFGFCGFITSRSQFSFAKLNEELYKTSMGILTEAVKNFRTVTSFCSEDRIIEDFSKALEGPSESVQRQSIITGVLYGISQFLPFVIYPGLYYFTALFMIHYGADPKNSFIAVYTLLFSAVAIGNTQQYAPDMGKATSALYSIYGITDQPSKITSKEGAETKKEIKGKIEFKNVSFKYPTREEYILQNFNMVIEPGQKAAIVGISGSGKSTIIQLLERFYDVTSGSILVDGIDIKDYSLHHLRTNIGLVPQEPVLFDTTIEENVKYGKPDAKEEDVKEACKIAGALDFIEKIQKPEEKPGEVVIEIDKNSKSFGREVGAKGRALSGGEKQRLAIARAVLKKPKILLFDEATSALDSSVEKGVQDALNNVSVGRTSIVIAHRLGTITDNDTIFVLENGKIVESGKKKGTRRKERKFP